jgi:hypothetical protein
MNGDGFVPFLALPPTLYPHMCLTGSLSLTLSRFGVGWYDADLADPSPLSSSSSSSSNRFALGGDSLASPDPSTQYQMPSSGRELPKDDGQEGTEADFEREEQEERRKPCIFNSITPVCPP